MNILVVLAAATWRTSLLLMGAFVLSRLCRGDATRHAIWASALIVSCAVPVMSVLAPVVELELPNSWRPAERPAWTIDAGALLPEQGAPAVTLAVRENEPAVNWSAVLAFVWLLGAAITIASITRARWQVWRIRRQSDCLVDGSAAHLCHEIAAQLHVRSPRLLVADTEFIPFVSGIRSPTIILPRACLTWSAQRWQVVLMHELQHLRRRDGLIDLWADVCTVLYWFHPGVWFAVRQLHSARELACDDAVIANGVTPVAYAHELVELARAAKSRRIYSQLAVLQPASLPNRISRLLQRPRIEPPPIAKKFGIAVIALGLVCCLIGLRFADVEEAAQIAAIAQYASHTRLANDDYVRERAIWAIGQTQDGRIVEPLIAQLRNPDWRVRSYAAWALALTRDRRATLPLIEALQDSHWRVRGHASFALDEIGDPSALAAMTIALSDAIWQVRIDAVEFVAKHGGTTGRELLRRIERDDSHPKVRKEATEELMKP